MCVIVINGHKIPNENELVENLKTRYPEIKAIVKNINMKNTNEKLYEVALFLQAKKENKAVDINIPLLKELSKYQVALANKNVDELTNLSMQNDFLLKEFAIFNKALLLSNEGKYDDAKATLKLIPQTSKAFELANLLNHYLLTK